MRYRLQPGQSIATCMLLGYLPSALAMDDAHEAMELLHAQVTILVFILVMAAATVIAYMNHKLQKSQRQLRSRLDQTEAIARLSERVSHTEPLELIYEMAMDSLQHLIHCDRTSILLFDDDGVIRFKAWRGLSDAYRQRFEGHSPWQSTATNVQPILVNDSGNWEDGKTLITEFSKEGIGALAFIPLEYQNRLLGKFMVYFNVPHTFSQEEVRLMQTVSHHVGYAIGQKRTNEALQESEQRWSFALEGGGDCVWDWDLTTNRVELSKGGKKMFGFEENEIGNDMMDWQGRVHPHDLNSLQTSVVSYFKSGAPHFAAEYRVKCKDGSWKWILTRGMAVARDNNHRITRMIGTHTDINQRKLAEEKIASENRKNETLLNTGVDGIHIMDENGTLLQVSDAFCRMLGYSREEMLGMNLMQWDAKLPSLSQFQQGIQKMPEQGKRLETLHRHKDGHTIPVEISARRVLIDGKVYIYAAARDITEKKQAEEIIHRQANYDPLTSLPNRRLFHDRLDQEIKKAHRAGMKMALMFIDLDNFKEVNDTLGHDKGDQLLVEAAERLSQCVRESDTVARLGGDEFTVILSELEEISGIDQVAQNIINRLVAPFTLGSDKAFVSASIGITLYPDDALKAEALLKNADQAMYVAKNAGRNRYSYFTAELQRAAEARMRLTHDLRAALAQQEFCAYYQPIVELSSGNIHKAEALIRWQHPQRGLVSPLDFIPLAEETGLIVEVGDWVYKEATRQVHQLRQRYHPAFQISINVSPVQFNNVPTLYHDWAAWLHQHDYTGQSIVLEITEGLLLDASNGVQEKLLAFRDAGIQVAMDDFGTGYSSLSYLKKFDIDYLKIDQSFVRNLERESDDIALCEAIIVMAHKIGLKVIAEGVETEAQRKLLTDAGCDYAQGYYYSKPLPAEAFMQFLQAHEHQRRSPA